MGLDDAAPHRYNDAQSDRKATRYEKRMGSRAEPITASRNRFRRKREASGQACIQATKGMLMKKKGKYKQIEIRDREVFGRSLKMIWQSSGTC